MHGKDKIRTSQKGGEKDVIIEDDLLNFSEDDTGSIQTGLSLALLDADDRAGFFGAAFNGWNGVFVAGIYSIYSDDIEREGPGGQLSKESDCIASAGFISFGMDLGVASIGLSLKAIYEEIGDYSFFGFGSDVGAQLEVIPFVRVGLVVQDIGTGLRPGKEYEHIENEYNFVSPIIKFSAAVNGISGLSLFFTGIKELNYDPGFRHGI